MNWGLYIFPKFMLTGSATYITDYSNWEFFIYGICLGRRARYLRSNIYSSLLHATYMYSDFIDVFVRRCILSETILMTSLSDEWFKITLHTENLAVLWHHQKRVHVHWLGVNWNFIPFKCNVTLLQCSSIPPQCANNTALV
jgi:hypothetical protein